VIDTERDNGWPVLLKKFEKTLAVTRIYDIFVIHVLCETESSGEPVALRGRKYSQFPIGIVRKKLK